MPMTPRCQSGLPRTRHLYFLSSPRSSTGPRASLKIFSSVLWRWALSSSSFWTRACDLGRVLREEEPDGEIGHAHAAGGVDPRAEAEAEVALGDLPAAEPAGLDQAAQARVGDVAQALPGRA